MSLKERLRTTSTTEIRDLRKELFSAYGVLKNPFPVAGEPSGHPHHEIRAEDEIVRAVEVFDRDRTSQVLLVEGTQGVGKTNLLNYFQSELDSLYEGAQGFYIIRYYPDPESTFDGIIRRLFQEFHQEELLANLGRHLHQLSPEAREDLLETAHSHEARLMLTSLSNAAGKSEEELSLVAEVAFEWLSGMRLLNKHRVTLHIHFRLDTIESKTQALRDMVMCSSAAGLLKGMFLLLDELEKQDYSVSKTVVLRYLSAVRALIDALPNHLFMLIALTPAARTRYFSMLPAFAGRLQNIVQLKPLATDTEALPLFHFYINDARVRAKEDSAGLGKAGTKAILSDAEVQELFRQLLRRAAAEKAQEGVTQRDFLNALHRAVETKISKE
jgi:hypothetical protein